MPQLGYKAPPYKPQRDLEIKWSTFNGGWNNIFRPTELKPNELAQADNLMLVGSGVPTGRWGSLQYYQSGPTGQVRMMQPYYNSLTSTNLLLTLTDFGFITQKVNASYSIITGASFASGYRADGIQMGNNIYFVGGNREFIKFDGSTLLPYATLPVPTGVTATNLSGASGPAVWSWIITGLSQVGENVGSTPISLTSLPQDLTRTSVRVNWSTISAASGLLKGYSIYRGLPGEETFIATVGPQENSFIDTGSPQSETAFPPLADTTGGVRAKYILKFDDRIVLAGIEGNPSMVLISGRYPYNDRFNWADGGGFILVDPNGGDDITGLGIAGNQGMSTGGSSTPASAILVFKNNQVHRVVLSTVTIGSFTILDPQAQLLTSSNGCSSADTIRAVENDTFYFGRKGLYVVGQEPNFLNQIRTNELSARVRNFVQGLSDADLKSANAEYIDNKYILSFPLQKKSIIYDRERSCFMGPWYTPWGITKWCKYYDASGNEKWLAGTDNLAYVYEFASAYSTDDGTAVAKILRTKKEDVQDFSVLKVLKLFYVAFRNVKGNVTVNIRLEERSGNTVTTKSFNISSALGSSGWGNDMFGDTQYGQTDSTVTLTGDELVRWTSLYKTARIVQVEVQSTGAQDNWEFLNVKFTTQSLGEGSLSGSYRV